MCCKQGSKGTCHHSVHRSVPNATMGKGPCPCVRDTEGLSSSQPCLQSPASPNHAAPSSSRSCIAPAACSCAHAKPRAIFAPAAVETLLLHPRCGDRGIRTHCTAPSPKSAIAWAPSAVLQLLAPSTPGLCLRDTGTIGVPQPRWGQKYVPIWKITSQLCHPS